MKQRKIELVEKRPRIIERDCEPGNMRYGTLQLKIID